MARAPTMVIQDDYIDMDLIPASPKRALLEFEFHSAAAANGAVSSSRHDRREAPAHASPADELFYRGKLLPLHLPPRLQLVQKLLQEQQVRVPDIKPLPAAPSAAEAEDGKPGAAKKYSWSKRLKLMKRWTSREYIRSFFLARPGDAGVPNAAGCSGGSSARGGAPDQDEACGGHRRSFSGIIRRVRLVVATKTSTSSAAPGTSPLCSSSSASSSSASTPSCGNAERFFLRARAAAPALKRSSSAGSEEGGVHGAIAHCKRSHQQLLLQQGRKSASGVVFYSLANTPRISTSTSVAAAAANEPVAQERQEICRG